MSDLLDEIIAWTVARKEYYRRPDLKTAKMIWTGRKFDTACAWFELAMPLIPKPLLVRVISLLK